MQHFYQKMAVMAVSAVLATPAFAYSYSSAFTNSFYWALTDLDPDDGIAPSITWNENFDSVVFGSIFEGGTQLRYFESNGSGTFGDVSDSVNTPLTQAGARVSSSNALSAFGANSANDTQYHATAWPGAHPGSFTLSPQTEVQFFLVGNVYAESTAEVNTYNYADAYAGLGVFDALGPYDTWVGIRGSEIEASSKDGVTYVSLYDVSDYSTIAGYPLLSSGTTLWLDVSYSNTSNDLKNGYIFQYAGVAGASITTPVPEPENYALLMAGLGLIGLFTKRRNNAQP